MARRSVPVELVDDDEHSSTRAVLRSRRLGVAAGLMTVVAAVSWVVAATTTDGELQMVPGTSAGPSPSGGSTTGPGPTFVPEPAPELDPPVDPDVPPPPEPDAARLAELARVPGVLGLLGDAPAVLAADSVLVAAPGGALVGATLVAPGTPGGSGDDPVVAGLDARTGQQRWAADLRDHGWSPPPRVEGSGWDGCRAAGPTAVCRRHDWSADPSWHDTSELWAFGGADGAVLWRRAVEPGDEWTVTTDLVVVAAAAGPASTPEGPGGTAAVRRRATALDPATGAEVWTWASPSVATTVSVDGVEGALDYAHALAAGRGRVVVAVGGRGWCLAAVDGAPVDEFDVPPGAAFGSLRNGGLLLAVPGDGRLLTEDGWRPVGAPGQAVSAPQLAVDDGSAPGLDFLAIPAAGVEGPLSAVDSRTGDLVWQERVPDASRLLLLDSVLYSAGPTGVAALDATSGERIWTVRREGDVAWLATDGRALLLVGPRATLEARALADGRMLWRADVSSLVPGADLAGTVVVPGSVYLGAPVPYLVVVAPGRDPVPIG